MKDKAKSFVEIIRENERTIQTQKRMLEEKEKMIEEMTGFMLRQTKINENSINTIKDLSEMLNVSFENPGFKVVHNTIGVGTSAKNAVKSPLTIV